MKPENILKSDILDIIFENKNKDYGAYDLRKTYPQRITKSLAIMLSCVLLFAGLQSWKSPKKRTTLNLGPVIEVKIADFGSTKNEPKEKPKPKVPAKQKMAAVDFVNPVVVEDNLVNKKIAEMKAIDTSFISNYNDSNSLASPNIVGVVAGIPDPKPPTGVGSGDDGKGNKPDPEDDFPIYNPSQQPEYPGGLEALRNFMIRNLRQPDDMQEGEKIVVLAKFVVDKTGAIEQIEIMQSGRDDLDKEVVRVIKKMPHWKPGNQAGKMVDVYFKLPITFTNQE